MIAALTGYGSTADAYRITDIHPDGRGAIACMRMAIQDAGVSPADVDYVNAHGTATRLNDPAESRALRQVCEMKLIGREGSRCG